MFGHRFFGSRYYAPRYFGDGGVGAPPAGTGDDMAPFIIRWRQWLFHQVRG